MELRAICRHAGIILSFGTASCNPPQQPDGATADVSSSSTGSPSTGDTPTSDAPTTSGPGTSGGSTGPGTSSTGAGTTGTGPVCGDGVLDPDSEECDIGDDNSNVGPCTLQCSVAVCGDGLIWAGAEQCDNGEANSFDYGGCRPDDCTWAPRCGDGTVDVGIEQCDLAELNGTGEAPEGLAACNSGCRWVARLAFLSSKTYPGALGGVSGADLRCQGLASTAGFANASKYRAWISDGVQSPTSRFDQVALSGAPYVLPDGRILASGFPELVEMGPRVGISLTETGEVVFEALVRTNTSAAGEPFSVVNHCNEWTASDVAGSARAGYNAVPVEEGPDWDAWRSERLWTSYLGLTCNELAHLYCFEDAEPGLP
jgi:hypothetical protein